MGPLQSNNAHRVADETFKIERLRRKHNTKYRSGTVTGDSSVLFDAYILDLLFIYIISIQHI